MSTGFCSYGEKCNFAHGTKELATNPLGKQQGKDIEIIKLYFF